MLKNVVSLLRNDEAINAGMLLTERSHLLRLCLPFIFWNRPCCLLVTFYHNGFGRIWRICNIDPSRATEPIWQICVAVPCQYWWHDVINTDLPKSKLNTELCIFCKFCCTEWL